MSNPERVVGKKAKVVEVKPNNNSSCGGFQPFQKRVFSETDPQPAAVKAVGSAPAVKAVASAPATTTSSTTETCGVGKEGEERMHQQQSQTRRKQRRCWSPELHRRFLHALQQLGGSHGKRFNFMTNDYLVSDWLISS